MGSACFMGSGRNSTITLGQFQAPIGILTNNNPTEAQALITVRAAAVVDYMASSVDANGTSRVTMFRKNNADTTVSPAITNSTAGVYYDSAHSVSLAVNDTFDYNLRGTAPAFIPYTVMIKYRNTGPASGSFYGYGNTSFVSGTVRYMCIGNGGASVGVESQAAITMRTGGTVSYGTAVVTAGAGAAMTIISRKNGANGNISISVGSGLTGQFVDTTHTDSFSAGDTYNFQNTCATFGTVRWQGNCYIEFTGTDVELPTVSADWTFNASAQYCPLVAGNVSLVTTESLVAVKLGIAGTLSRMRFVVAANAQTGTGVVVLRKNNATANSTVSIGAGTTGQFEDTTNTDSFVATDTLNFMFTGGTANTMNGGGGLFLLSRIANAQPVSPVCTSSVVMTKAVAKGIAATCVSAMTMLRRTAKNIALTCASTVTVARAKKTLQSVAATCASTVTMLRQTGKRVAITCASAVTMIKAITKTIALTCVSTVTVIKQLARSISVTCVSTVSMLKQTGKLIVITCASTVSITKLRTISQFIAVTCASLVTMTKRVGKTIAITCVSAVTKINQISKSIATTCASVVTVTKSNIRSIAVICVSVVTMTRQTLKRIAITCASSVTVASMRVGLVTITITCASAVTKQLRTNKLINLIAVTSVTVTRSMFRIILVSVSTTVLLTKNIVKAIAAVCTSAVTVLKARITSISVSCASAVTQSRVTGKLVDLSSATSVTMSRLLGITIDVLATASVTVNMFINKFLSIISATSVHITFQAELIFQTINVTCTAAVNVSKKIFQRINVYCEVQVIRVGKTISKTVNALSVAVVTIVQRYFLPVIRTPIFGRANSPMIALGEDRIARIGGRSSTVQIDGKAEPEE